MSSFFLLVAAVLAGAGWMAMRRGVAHASMWTGGWSVVALGLAVVQLTAPPPTLTQALQRADDFNTSAGVVLGRHKAGKKCVI